VGFVIITSFAFAGTLGFVFACGTVFTTHHAAGYYGAAVDTFAAPMAVNMLSGRGLKTAVAV
jgi:hypothetical protein